MNFDLIVESDPVVGVIGMAGRFPGADDIESLWALLRDGREGVAPVEGLSLGQAALPDKLRGTPGYVGIAGSLSNIDQFDAEFFAFSPRQAGELDPQQRLFLECAWHALEDAGVDPQRFDGSIGVFAGAGPVRYAIERIGANARNQRVLDLVRQTLSVDKDFLATRVSYKLNLRGPSITVQTACSTSLVAIHMACQSLMNGECDIALAGGVNIPVPHGLGYHYAEGGILSPDGHCRAFDKNARGTVPGAGAGVVVLRRLEDARAARHPCYAAIRNSAINNDGSAKVGFTAPSVDGQREVLQMALVGTDPATVGMIEAHGTGTSLGDAIELTALREVFQASGAAARSCALGSVKTNIGHLDAAAGIAGFIKAALCLDRRHLVPSLHFSQPHELLEPADVPFFVNTDSRPWVRGSVPRRAGVSSFGMGGTNAHVLLEEMQQPVVDGEPAGGAHLFPLAARTPRALQAMARRLADHVRVNPTVALASVANTLQTGRAQFGERAVVLAASHDELACQLERIVEADAVHAAGQQVVLHFDAAFGPVPEGRMAFEPGDGAWQRDADDLMLGLGPVGDAAIWAPMLEQVCNARALLRSGLAPAFATATGAGVFAAACAAGAFSAVDCGRLILLAVEGGAGRVDAINGLLRRVAAAPLAFPIRVGRAGPLLASGQLLQAAHWLGYLDGEPDTAPQPTDAGNAGDAPLALPCSTDALRRWADRHGQGFQGGSGLPTVLQRVIAVLWLHGGAVDWLRGSGEPRRALARLPGYPFQRTSHWLADEDMAGAVAHWLPAWKPLPLLSAKSSPATGRWLVVAPTGAFADQVRARIASVGGDSVAVVTGDADETPTDWPQVWRTLAAAGKKVDHLVVVVPPAVAAAGAGGESLDDAQSRGFLAVLDLARAAIGHQPGSPLAICIATRRLAADLQHQVDPMIESVVSLPALLPQLARGLSAKVVDLGPLPASDAELAQQARHLVSEAAHADGPALLAYRSGRRLMLGFDEASAAAPDAGIQGLLRAGGTYLLTGGLGMIGLALAQSLATSHQATLLLLGRHDLPPRARWSDAGAYPDAVAARIRAIDAIECSGGRVEVLVADVADAAAVGRAVAAAEQRHGPVNGVFHLAAALGDASMGVGVDQLAPGHLAAQVRPKAGGLIALEEVFSGAALDFAIVFSSTSALLGGTGLAAYAAANAVVDGLARSLRACGGAPWMAIGWDSWASDGSALQGPLALSMDEGLAALRGALGWKGLAQVVVSRQSLATRLLAQRHAAAVVESRIVLPAASDAGVADEAGHASHATDGSAVEGVQLQAMITRVWEEHLGCSGIQPDDDFFKLGGDSLSMLGVTQRVAELLHIEVPLRDFLRSGLTVRGFTGTVLAQFLERTDGAGRA